MKIIDLLNKIANGEEVPEYIKYYDKIHSKEDIMLCCYANLIYKLDNDIVDLVDEVEILEEEKKIPEKLNFDTDELRGKETPRAIDYLIESKINQVIDYLKSKGE